MAIGNRAYVKKHYGQVVEQAIQHYEELIQLFRELDDIESLERAFLHSKHRWAWHGVVIRRTKQGFEWRPASFYGYVCLTPDEYLPILQGEQTPKEGA